MQILVDEAPSFGHSDQPATCWAANKSASVVRAHEVSTDCLSPHRWSNPVFLSPSLITRTSHPPLSGGAWVPTLYDDGRPCSNGPPGHVLRTQLIAVDRAAQENDEVCCTGRASGSRPGHRAGPGLRGRTNRGRASEARRSEAEALQSADPEGQRQASASASSPSVAQRVDGKPRRRLPARRNSAHARIVGGVPQFHTTRGAGAGLPRGRLLGRWRRTQRFLRGVACRMLACLAAACRLVLVFLVSPRTLLADGLHDCWAEGIA